MKQTQQQRRIILNARNMIHKSIPDMENYDVSVSIDNEGVTFTVIKKSLSVHKLKDQK